MCIAQHICAVNYVYYTPKVRSLHVSITILSYVKNI
jgi:hypothetical protein